MSIWTRATNHLLRRTGEVWTTTLKGECVEFYGIFDAENRLETDNGGMQVLIAGSVVQVLSSIADQFVFNQELKDQNEVVWYCRETMKIDDGTLSRCTITEKPTT